MRDVILGGQDGLVNVLGIVLGVAAASHDHKILIAAGMAAAFAEAVSMAAVAYTSTLAQIDHYDKEVQMEKDELEKYPVHEASEIRDMYQKKGFSGKLLEDIVTHITGDRELWLRTMVREELELAPTDKSSILKIASVVGIAALLASFVPIAPFFFLPHLPAMVTSLILSCLTLFCIGAYEAKTYVGSWIKNGFQIMAIGMGAAGIGYLIGIIFHVS